MCKAFFLLLFSGSFAFADLQYSLETYIYINKYQVADSIINAQNQILKLPQEQAEIDVRGELKWRKGLDQVIVRPRLSSTYKNIVYGANSTQEQENKSKADLTDAFYERYWSNSFSTTLGLQVYQWGPAEFINASNPIFHFNSRQRNLFYKEKGQVLLRGNYTFNKENNLVLILQPISNNEPEWIAEAEFSPKGLVKYEKSWSGTANQVGLVAGIEEKNNVFLGQYFNFTFAERFSIYADVKESKNRINFVPNQVGATTFLDTPDMMPLEWGTLAVAGARWEGDFDLRLEQIYNGAGFDKSELNQVILSISDATNPAYLRNLSRFQRIGLELLGKNYTYFSFRMNEPLKFKDFNIYARYLYSGQDGSSSSQFEADLGFLEAWQVFGNFTFINGNLDTEFRLLNDWQALVGLKWAM
jgi:hypothetical protein